MFKSTFFFFFNWVKEEFFPRSSGSTVALPLKDTAVSRITTRNIAQIQQENSSMPAPPWWQLSSVPCHCSPWWEQKRLPRGRCPTFAAWQAAPSLHPPTATRWCPGLWPQQSPSARWSPASLGVLHVSCCHAAILVIPAMGKRSPAERQLLASETVPKKSPHWLSANTALFTPPLSPISSHDIRDLREMQPGLSYTASEHWHSHGKGNY